jgi:hypothetical protein
MSELTITHNSGFFSCCSVKLSEIINFFNTQKREPNSIDSKFQFASYKINPYNPNEDLGNLLFEDPNIFSQILYKQEVDYHHNHQFTNYKKLNYRDIVPFIQKYFSPTKLVQNYIQKLETKYCIDYNNTVAVFYRGNDKCTETGIASYEVFADKCKQIQHINPQVTFLIQTDETEFKEYFIQRFSNSFFLQELPTLNKDPSKAIQFVIAHEQRPEFALRFLSSTIIVSKCKHLVTHTGNCGIWACLFRGHPENLYQYIQHPDPMWL